MPRARSRNRSGIIQRPTSLPGQSPRQVLGPKPWDRNQARWKWSFAIVSDLADAFVDEASCKRPAICPAYSAIVFLRSLRSIELFGACPQARDQLASKIDGVFERIEAADQERMDAELVVFEQGTRDLLGRADQARRVAHRARRLGDGHPQPLVMRLALRREVEQTPRRLIKRLLVVAEAGRIAGLLDRRQDAARAIPRRPFGGAEDRPERHVEGG